MASVQRKLVHKQFNSPMGLYSQQNVKETLDRELKAFGADGIEVDDGKPLNLANSAVLRAVEEEEQMKCETTCQQEYHHDVERRSRPRQRQPPRQQRPHTPLHHQQLEQIKTQYLSHQHDITIDRDTVLKINRLATRRHLHKRDHSWPPTSDDLNSAGTHCTDGTSSNDNATTGGGGGGGGVWRRHGIDALREKFNSPTRIIEPTSGEMRSRWQKAAAKQRATATNKSAHLNGRTLTNGDDDHNKSDPSSSNLPNNDDDHHDHHNDDDDVDGKTAVTPQARGFGAPETRAADIDIGLVQPKRLYYEKLAKRWRSCDDIAKRPTATATATARAQHHPNAHDSHSLERGRSRGRQLPPPKPRASASPQVQRRSIKWATEMKISYDNNATTNDLEHIPLPATPQGSHVVPVCLTEEEQGEAPRKDLATLTADEIYDDACIYLRSIDLQDNTVAYIPAAITIVPSPTDDLVRSWSEAGANMRAGIHRTKSAVGQQRTTPEPAPTYVTHLPRTGGDGIQLKGTAASAMRQKRHGVYLDDDGVNLKAAHKPKEEVNLTNGRDANKKVEIAALEAKYERIQESIAEHLKQIDIYMTNAKNALNSTLQDANNNAEVENAPNGVSSNRDKETVTSPDMAASSCFTGSSSPIDFIERPLQVLLRQMLRKTPPPQVAGEPNDLAAFARPAANTNPVENMPVVEQALRDLSNIASNLLDYEIKLLQFANAAKAGRSQQVIGEPVDDDDDDHDDADVVDRRARSAATQQQQGRERVVHVKMSTPSGVLKLEHKIAPSAKRAHHITINDMHDDDNGNGPLMKGQHQQHQQQQQQQQPTPNKLKLKLKPNQNANNKSADHVTVIDADIVTGSSEQLSVTTTPPTTSQPAHEPKHMTGGGPVVDKLVSTVQPTMRTKSVPDADGKSALTGCQAGTPTTTPTPATAEMASRTCPQLVDQVIDMNVTDMPKTKDATTTTTASPTSTNRYENANELIQPNLMKSAETDADTDTDTDTVHVTAILKQLPPTTSGTGDAIISDSPNMDVIVTSNGCNRAGVATTAASEKPDSPNFDTYTATYEIPSPYIMRQFSWQDTMVDETATQQPSKAPQTKTKVTKVSPAHKQTNEIHINQQQHHHHHHCDNEATEMGPQQKCLSVTATAVPVPPVPTPPPPPPPPPPMALACSRRRTPTPPPPPIRKYPAALREPSVPPRSASPYGLNALEHPFGLSEDESTSLSLYAYVPQFEGHNVGLLVRSPVPPSETSAPSPPSPKPPPTKMSASNPAARCDENDKEIAETLNAAAPLMMQREALACSTVTTVNRNFDNVSPRPYNSIEGYKRVAWPPVSEERIVREFTPQPQTQPQSGQYMPPQQQQQQQAPGVAASPSPTPTPGTTAPPQGPIYNNVHPTAGARQASPYPNSKYTTQTPAQHYPTQQQYHPQQQQQQHQQQPQYQQRPPQTIEEDPQQTSPIQYTQSQFARQTSREPSYVPPTQQQQQQHQQQQYATPNDINVGGGYGNNGMTTASTPFNGWKPIQPPVAKNQYQYGGSVAGAGNQQQQQQPEQLYPYQQQQQQQQQPQQQQYRAQSYDNYSQHPPQQQQQQQPTQYHNQTPYQPGQPQQPQQQYQLPYQQQQQQQQQPQGPQQQPHWAHNQQAPPQQPPHHQYQPHPQQQQQYQAPPPTAAPTSYPYQYEQPPMNQFNNSYSQPSQDQIDHQQRQQSLPQDYRGGSPGIITLRKEAPVTQMPSPVITSQPAAVSYQGGCNMRGDLKWPPQEYKEAAAVENEARRQLALGPVCRPRKVKRDYTTFFAKNALNSYYPSYKVPPGTQHMIE